MNIDIISNSYLKTCKALNRSIFYTSKEKFISFSFFKEDT